MSMGGASTPTSGTRHFQLPKPPAAPAVPPASKCTRRRVEAVKSLIGKTCLAKPGIQRLLCQLRKLGIGFPRAVCPPCCQRVNFWFEFDPLGKGGSCLSQIPFEPERCSDAKMDKVEPSSLSDWSLADLALQR